MKRRSFIKNTAYTAALGYLNTLLLPEIFDPNEIFHLTIMHTNDVHSRIDPFPMDGSRNEGQGGVARRKTLIDKIRKEGQQTLLLDAGDMFQGTPYFNLYGGELEIKLMSQLGYDAGTIGNHDFDGGIDGLAKQLDHATFDLVNSNYILKDTVLHDKHKKYKVWDYGNIKVGMYGLGIAIKGLVPDTLVGETRYTDPVVAARKQEEYLKKEMGCDYVICLSHLGYKYRDEQVSDVVIAKNTQHTDLIIGGHTHTFMREPDMVNNQNGKPVIVNQVGFAGIYLGRIDLYFERGSKKIAQRGCCVSVRPS